MVNVDAIIKKYYQQGTELYSIFMAHATQVRDCALTIAEKHTELVLDKEFVAEAAMLHDIGIFLCDAPGIHCVGTHEYIEHGYLGADLLRAENLPRHALVSERHTGVGISLEMILQKNYPLPHRNLQPVTLEEKLVCYADKFYSKTKLDKQHTIERIREKISKFGDTEVAKFDELHALFG